MTLAGLDTFGWSMLFFVTLLFGIPYSRYFLRVRSIPSWPIVNARITEALPQQGSPVGMGYGANLLWHCRVSYAYEAQGKLYGGSFALMTGNEQIATSVGDQLSNGTIMIRYNPKRPADSLPDAKRVLDKKVYQSQSWMNPNVW